MTDMDFREFILAHDGEDPSRLALQRDRWPGIDISLACSTIAARRKIRTKAPAWYAEPELLYPNSLCVEQCSSQATALLKARLIHDTVLKGAVSEVHPSGNGKVSPTPSPSGNGVYGAGTNASAIRIADLTGGLGMDSWAFSQYFTQVLYNEANPALADVAPANFATLSRHNILTSCAELRPLPRPATEVTGAAGLWQRLKEFAPDVIYLDPARRSSDGSKVFRIQDCTPNILTLKDDLLDIARYLVVKLSPMADIRSVLDELGAQCSEVNILSSSGECRELLVTMDRQHKGDCRITARCGDNGAFSFFMSEETSCSATFLADIPDCSTGLEGLVLLEPDKALMKAAPFNLLSHRLHLAKLDVSTHYYVCREDRFLQDLFKAFIVLKDLPLDKRTIKSVGKEFPQAEVTARNIRMTSDELRKRLGTRASDTFHIFGLSILRPSTGTQGPVSRENRLLVTARLGTTKSQPDV